MLCVNMKFFFREFCCSLTVLSSMFHLRDGERLFANKLSAVNDAAVIYYVGMILLVMLRP